MRDSRLMNNIMYGCARAYNAIHQSPVLNNVRAVFPNRINTFAGMQCSATRKCKSFAQTLPLGGSGNQTRSMETSLHLMAWWKCERVPRMHTSEEQSRANERRQ